MLAREVGAGRGSAFWRRAYAPGLAAGSPGPAFTGNGQIYSGTTGVAHRADGLSRRFSVAAAEQHASEGEQASETESSLSEPSEREQRC